MEGSYAQVMRELFDLRRRVEALEVQEPERTAARVYNSGNISIPNATWTALTFDSEAFDPRGLHSTSTNTSRVTISQAGLYMIGGMAVFDANSAGFRGLRLRLNGSTTFGTTYINPRAGDYEVDMEIVSLYALAANAYVELLAFQNSGGALNVLGGTYSPMLWVVKV